MTGLLPPSSSVHVLRLERAAACATARPATGDPVNEILRIFICDASSSPVSLAPLRILRTPSGILIYNFGYNELDVGDLQRCLPGLCDKRSKQESAQWGLLTRLYDAGISSRH